MLNLYPWIRNNWDLKEPEFYLGQKITRLCSGNKVSIGGSPTQAVKGNKKNFNMLCNSRFLIGRIKFEVCAFRGVRASSCFNALGLSSLTSSAQARADHETGFAIFYHLYGVCDLPDSTIYVINCSKFNWNHERSGWFSRKSLKIVWRIVL